MIGPLTQTSMHWVEWDHDRPSHTHTSMNRVEWVHDGPSHTNINEWVYDRPSHININEWIYDRPSHTNRMHTQLWSTHPPTLSATDWP